MIVEILYPEVCNLYGDLQNAHYLARCCDGIEVVQTHLHETPRFLTQEVALVSLSSTTEQGLRLAADALRPYGAQIAEKIDGGQLFLATGNGADILCAGIDSDRAASVEGLNLLSGRAQYRMLQRHNSFFVGSFEDFEVVGFKSLFGHIHGSDDAPLFARSKGVGRDGTEHSDEGFLRGGLMATHLIGPLLILNPPLCKWLLRRMGAADTLAFEEAAFESYRRRLQEFKETGRSWKY